MWEIFIEPLKYLLALETKYLNSKMTGEHFKWKMKEGNYPEFI